MKDARRYYQRKGTVPDEHTKLGQWCTRQGYDIAKVVSGEQPI